MYYSQEQIDRANQTNMEDFLRSQGETLIRSGKEYRWKCHDSLTARGNKWFRHSQSRGGYPVGPLEDYFSWIGPPLLLSFREQLKVDETEARRLLEFQPDMKISRLAELVGYPLDGQYFSKVFRKICGVTPTEYRNHH